VELQNTLGPWLGKTTKMLACLVSETFQKNQIDLTREQWVFLIKLHQKDGLQQNELAFITERDKTSLARLVKTMERKNFIIRKVSEIDKRSKLVFLTNEGRAVYEKATPIMQNMIKSLQTGLTDEAIQNTIATLKKFQESIQAQSSNCRSTIK